MIINKEFILNALNQESKPELKEIFITANRKYTLLAYFKDFRKKSEPVNFKLIPNNPQDITDTSRKFEPDQFRMMMETFLRE
jgi:hypothetical protein